MVLSFRNKWAFVLGLNEDSSLQPNFFLASSSSGINFSKVKARSSLVGWVDKNSIEERSSWFENKLSKVSCIEKQNKDDAVFYIFFLGKRKWKSEFKKEDVHASCNST